MKRAFTPFGGRLQDADGQSLIETAIITPLVLLLTIAIFEFGAVFYVFLSLQNGASQATRYAITGNLPAGATRVDSIKAAMRTSTPTIAIPDSAFSFSHLPSGGTAFVGGVGGPDEVEKVTINYTWKFFTPLMLPFFPTGSITMSVDSTMKNEPRFQ